MASVRDTNLKLYKATTRLNEFYAQPMQPSVSKFRAGSKVQQQQQERVLSSEEKIQEQSLFFCGERKPFFGREFPQRERESREVKREEEEENEEENEVPALARGGGCVNEDSIPKEEVEEEKYEERNEPEIVELISDDDSEE